MPYFLRTAYKKPNCPNNGLPKNVLQIYSETWFPDLDSEKWLSSLFSIRLN